MKKVISVLVAVLIIALSVLPAFAASVESPKATTANYAITLVQSSTVGGKASFSYNNEVDPASGRQSVHFTASPYDGYKFAYWTIEGDYDTSADLTNPDVDITVFSDAVVTPHFEKATSDTPAETKSGENNGSNSNGTDKSVSVDSSSTSPKTGANNVVPFAIVFVSVAAISAAVVLAKKTSRK